MSQVTPIPIESERRTRRTSKGWLAAIVLVGAAGLGVGFLAGRMGNASPGKGPAIDLAREIGMALPLEQQPAFVDGVIDEAEVRDAVDRFRACVEDQDVAGFTLEFRGQDGFGLSYGGGRDDGAIVQECQTRHFQATYLVWQRMQLLERQVQ